MKIVPKLNPGRVGFRGSFWHPVEKRTVTFGLGADETVATEICGDVCDIFAAGIRDEKDRRLFGFHPRAVAIVFGIAAPASQAPVIGSSPFDDDALGDLSGRIALRLGQVDAVDIVKALLERYESKLAGELLQQVRDLQSQNKVLKGRAESAEYELARLRRDKASMITATIGEAVAVWKEFYKVGRSERTVVGTIAAVDSFVESLPKKESFRLVDIESEHVNAWILKLARQAKDGNALEVEADAAPLSPVTRKTVLRRLGAALSWIARKYKLIQNPIDNVEPIAGASKNPEHIVAVRRLEDLTALLEGLQPVPYWRALVATAIFTGARYSELVWMRSDQVFLEEEYIYIASRAAGKRLRGTKTGRERRIPIERSVYRSILSDHIQQREADRKGVACGLSSTAARSPWMFPTTIDEGDAATPRRKSLPGQWSDNGVFNRAWTAVVDALHTGRDGKVGEPKAFWRYGPSEWRHTFGTVLGHCGWSSLEIATVMGNTEDVARRFYIVPGHGGKRWPFKF